MTFVLTSGERHEAVVFERLMEQGQVKRRVGGPKFRPERVVGDKGYSSKRRRKYLRVRGIRVTIPHKSHERKGRFDTGIYRERNRVERVINRLKQLRRVATPYEQLAENYLAMLTLAAITIWL